MSELHEVPLIEPADFYARKLSKDTIAAIARHFSTKKIGWRNEWHFMKLAHLPPNVKALVGGKDGPSSSKRA